jgi:hypothetical protein
VVTILAGSALLPGNSVSAQCTEQWFATAGVSGVATPAVFAIEPWDPDGPGPQGELLVIGGDFAAAGATPAANIAAWDGTNWFALGQGTNGRVYALAVLPNGELIAGGAFTMAGGASAPYIARWDGTAWSGLSSGMNNEINDLAVMPNGDLIAGGMFNTAGGVPTNYVARWNGTAWSGLGSGVGSTVYALLVVPGTGDLIVGGMFTTAGGSSALRVARWNGATWTGIGGMTSGGVFSLGLMPNGDIVAGGNFIFPGSRVSRWNGTSWTNLGTGVNNAVWALTAMEDGDLVAGGSFTIAGGQPIFVIARWDGSAWSGLGSGLAGGNVQAFDVRPNGDLWVGGVFTTAGGLPSPGLARWATPSPEIIQQPLSTGACTSGSAVFDISANGTGVLIYQWQAELTPGVWTDLVDGDLVFNSTLLGTVIGAASDTLQIGSLTHFLEDRSALNVRCMITDDCRATTSNPCAMTVWASGTADADNDGVADGSDVQMFVNFLIDGGAPDAPWCACDFDGNASVDIADMSGFVAALIGA